MLPMVGRCLLLRRREFPDPALPTYEHCSEWVTGEYVVRHVHVELASVDYDQHTIDDWEVDPATVQVLP